MSGRSKPLKNPASQGAAAKPERRSRAPAKGNRSPRPKRELFYTSDRRLWRRWLRRNRRTRPEVWLVYYRKQAGRPRIAYNDAVEEALCFGWIDSTVMKIDDQRFAQRFSPRKPGSAYSQANIERLRRLIPAGKVAKDVVGGLGKVLTQANVIPPDILKAIRSNPAAWRNFRRFSPSYRRIRIAFIEGARNRPGEFRKRLEYFIRMTEQNRTFGFGGIDKYY